MNDISIRINCDFVLFLGTVLGTIDCHHIIGHTHSTAHEFWMIYRALPFLYHCLIGMETLEICYVCSNVFILELFTDICRILEKSSTSGSSLKVNMWCICISQVHSISDLIFKQYTNFSECVCQCQVWP